MRLYDHQKVHFSLGFIFFGNPSVENRILPLNHPKVFNFIPMTHSNEVANDRGNIGHEMIQGPILPILNKDLH